MKRRDFLARSLMGTPALAAGVASLSIINYKPPEESKTGLRLSFQESTAPGRCLEERLDFMEKYGIEGFEPRGTDLISRAGIYQRLLIGRTIKISAVCSGYKGFILCDNVSVRDRYKSILKDIIAFAGELGSVGVIIVPGTNWHTSGHHHSPITNYPVIEQLFELAEYASKNKTTVILEPQNRKESGCFQTVAEVARICRSLNNKGLRCMGDFWHMTREEVSDSDAFISAGEYLNHVHIASRKTRYLPGADGVIDDYTDGFTGLKKIKYQGYISFECGIKGDKGVLIPESINLLRRQWQIS